MAPTPKSHCNQGHKFTPETTKRKKNGGRECKTCAQARSCARFIRLTSWEKKERRAQSYKRNREKIGLPKKSPLDYLKMNPTQSEASDQFNFAVDDLGSPKCHQKPAEYIDYDERTPPDKVTAAKLCIGCPVFEQCDTLATALKPRAGVWAGRVWIDGKTEV